MFIIPTYHFKECSVRIGDWLYQLVPARLGIFALQVCLITSTFGFVFILMNRTVASKHMWFM